LKTARYRAVDRIPVKSMLMTRPGQNPICIISAKKYVRKAPIAKNSAWERFGNFIKRYWSVSPTATKK
jgi:hypothetical protein